MHPFNNAEMRKKFEREVLKPLGSQPHIEDPAFIETMYQSFLVEEAKKKSMDDFMASIHPQTTSIDRSHNARNNDIMSSQNGGNQDSMFHSAINSNIQYNAAQTAKSNQKGNIQKQGRAPAVVDSTAEAILHYYFGGGRPAKLGPKTIKTIIGHPEQIKRLNRIINKQTPSLSGNYGIDMTDWVFHLGNTNIYYDTVCNKGNCKVTFTCKNDGFWDITKSGDDGVGPNGELFGEPYPYLPFSWSIRFK